MQCRKGLCPNLTSRDQAESSDQQGQQEKIFNMLFHSLYNFASLAFNGLSLEKTDSYFGWNFGVSRTGAQRSFNLGPASRSFSARGDGQINKKARPIWAID